MNLPNIYANTPIALVSAKSVAQFPVNTFLENLAIASDGSIFITNHEVGEVIKLGINGELSTYTKLEGKVTGIALISEDRLIVNGWDSEGIPFVAILQDGSLESFQTIPDGMFPNGITRLDSNTFLMADSYRGVIWSVDVEKLSVEIWLEHPLLARNDSSSSFPAVNGLKIFDHVLYASNTQRMLMLRIPLNTNLQPLEPEIYLENTNIDDFAFDFEGNLYGATHVYNSVIRIDKNKQTTIIAHVTGCTAVAFYGTGLYVVNNGGMFLPPETGVEPSQLVHLEVGVKGMS